MSFYKFVSDKEGTTPSYFVNLNVDTVWLDRLAWMSDALELFDGTSVEPRPILWHRESFRCPPEIRIKSLAFDLESWKDPEMEEDYGPTTCMHALNGARELLIVIARPLILCPSKIIFVEPYCSVDVADTMKRFRTGLYPLQKRCTWNMAARRLERIFAELKTKRAEDRKRAVEGTKGSPVLQRGLMEHNRVRLDMGECRRTRQPPSRPVSLGNPEGQIC